MRRAAVLLALMLLLSRALALGRDAAAEGDGPDAPAVPDATAEELAWRARRPYVSLLLVGGQLGEVRPARSVRPPAGGLQRLAAVLERLRQRPRDGEAGFGAISLGWSMAGRGEEQEEAKADVYRAVLREMGFTGLLLGTPDLHVAGMRQAFDVADGGGAPGVDAPCPPLNVKLVGASASLSFLDLKVGA